MSLRFGDLMNVTLDQLAAFAADEFLLDDTGLLLAEEEGNELEDIRWENARTALAARAEPLATV
jgi:hypothetical protein